MTHHLLVITASYERRTSLVPCDVNDAPLLSARSVTERLLAIVGLQILCGNAGSAGKHRSRRKVVNGGGNSGFGGKE